MPCSSNVARNVPVRTSIHTDASENSRNVRLIGYWYLYTHSLIVKSTWQARPRSAGGNVAEDQNRPDRVPRLVPNRRGAVVDGPLPPVTGDEEGMVR